MYFCTKGEFIQALKDLTKLERQLAMLKLQYSKKEYLRYNKVGSSLNYDVIGYDSNGEALRQLKGHAYVSESQKLDLYEGLDKELQALNNSISEYENRISNIYKTLKICKKPLSDILYNKYVRGKPYCQISQEYSKVFGENSYPNATKRYIDCELNKIFNVK